MKTALIHDWLVTLAGAEKVLQAIYELYPSPIYTLLQDPARLKGSFLEEAEIHSSFLQKFPRAKKKYRSYLPFFPMAIESHDIRAADLLISSSHAVAKGVMTRPGQVHICYCHTPMRYAWDLTHEYIEQCHGLKKMVLKMILHYLRMWDVTSSSRVDMYIANSKFVAKRIKKYYGREAKVIYPPVDVNLIPLQHVKENFYLTASRFVPYKRIDLIVEAFAKMPEKRLIVVGEGPDEDKIKTKALENVQFLGRVDTPRLHDLMGKAKGFVFAAHEDFGIIPVEAQAAGTPVIAFGKGGALETVKPGITGHFFSEQTANSLINAIEEFEAMSFDPETIRAHAMQFSKGRFSREFTQAVTEAIS